jgi:6-phosphogluconolactonase
MVLSAIGCGGGSVTMMPKPPVPACTPAPNPEFAYVLLGTTVSMFTVDSCTGSLNVTTPATVPTGSSQGQIGAENMVADPSGRFVFVANLVSNATDAATISMYTVNSSTGVLTPTTPATIPTGFFPQGIAIDPAGKFVYTANSDDNTVSMFTINQTTGVLAPTTPAAVPTGWSPSSVTVHPSGKFAYAANQDDDTISMYTIDPNTGVLTPTSPATVPTGFSPFGVTVDPSGKFAYVPNAYDFRNVVSQYTIDPVTGVLTPNTPSTVTTGNQPTDVAVDPSGKFAYVVNRSDSTVTMYKIDTSSGNLTPNGTASAGITPFRITFDPSGKYVYVANEGSAVSIYTLGTDGVLSRPGFGDPNSSNSVAIAVTASKQ